MNVVFDIDGTLCFNGVAIESCIIDALKELEEKGNRVIFASARPIRDLVPVVREFANNLLIGGNGSIVSRAGQIEVIAPIPQQPFDQVVGLIQEFNLDYIVDERFNYAARVPSDNRIFRQLDPDKSAKNIALNDVKQPIKMILINMSPSTFQEVENRVLALQEELTVITHREENHLDMTAKGTTKHSTLQQLIGTEPYIAFGNDSNDVGLLNLAQQGYFVGDKQLADQLGIHAASILPKNPEKIAAAIRALG